MPISKKRKKKTTSRPTAAKPHRPRQIHPVSAPGTWDDEWPQEKMISFITSLPDDQLVLFGLPMFHIMWNPDRKTNNCLTTCIMLMLTFQRIGIPAEVVPLTLDIPWANKRYGSKELRVDRQSPDGEIFIDGHAGLLTPNAFMDPTAGQFKEIRAEGGMRPVIGKSSHEYYETILNEGANLQIKLISGKPVVYRVHHHYLAAGAIKDVLTMTGIENLAKASQSFLLSFAALLAAMHEHTSRDILAAPLPPTLRELVLTALKSDLKATEDGIMEFVPRSVQCLPEAPSGS